VEYGSLIDYQFFGLAAILLVYLLVPENVKEFVMASLGNLTKHLDNLKRAQGIVAKADQDATKHKAIMDSFEQRLAVNDENMGKLAELDKLMQQMDTLGNGGPALEATFSSSTASQPDLVSHSTIGIGKHGT
jgi:hypothetical protein